MAYRQDLGGDVVWCSHSCGAVDFAIGIHLQAGAKVSQPNVAVLVDENIVRLDVPMVMAEHVIRLDQSESDPGIIKLRFFSRFIHLPWLQFSLTCSNSHFVHCS